MGQIRVLDAGLVNRIAAGEVVERPASVVKELVENAVDAGGTHITLEIEDGGKRLIRVVDDGGGMDVDDLQLAVRPHATSKLASEDDLYRIRTLGFRGEALASIASISQLCLTSRPTGADEGHTVSVSAGEVDGPRVVGCATGTTVEVRQLFFNVPARAKFLRTASTEMSHIAEQVTRIALGHTDVGFTMRHNGRETHRLRPTDDLANRVGALFSAELADVLIPLHRHERGVRIEGLVAPPARARSSGKWQYVLLNGRFIRDRFVQHAITEAHRGLVDGHNHPVVFLRITVDPVSVDVNVHPTKIEVRWRDSGLIHSQVLSVLREALLSRDLTGQLDVSGRSTPVSEEKRETIRREMADYFKGATPQTPARAERGGEGTPNLSGGGSWTSPGSGGDRSGSVCSPAHHAALYGPVEPASSGPTAEPGDHAESNVQHQTELPATTSPRRAIQVHDTYLVAETDDGLMIVDQHALHERVLYNELRERLTKGPLESQRLLLPETVEVTEGQMAQLDTHKQVLEQLGFDISPFGRTTVAVHAVPSLLPDAAVRAFFTAMLDRLSELPAEPEAEEVLHSLIDTMACKAAVKAGDPLSASEIETLLDKGTHIEKASNCPHGRPTTLRLSVRDLEKQFHRT